MPGKSERSVSAAVTCPVLSFIKRNSDQDHTMISIYMRKGIIKPPDQLQWRRAAFGLNTLVWLPVFDTVQRSLYIRLIYTCLSDPLLFVSLPA